MSKHLFAFLLSELTHIRIVCKSCQTVTEISIDGLLQPGSRPLKCSGCALYFREGLTAMGVREPDAFDTFAEGVKQLKAQKAFGCEFFLPTSGPEAAKNQT